MRYMLAHMLEGDAKAQHLELSNALAKRFRLSPVASRILPHLTLKAPFETDTSVHIEELSALLKAFSETGSPEPFTLAGVGDFRKKVIYMEVHAPKQTHMLIRRLQDKLRNIPWLTFSPKEFPLDLHATLCYPKHPQQGKEIMAYLQKQELPIFTCVLDCITLLQNEEGVWRELERFDIG